MSARLYRIAGVILLALVFSGLALSLALLRPPSLTSTSLVAPTASLPPDIGISQIYARQCDQVQPLDRQPGERISVIVGQCYEFTITSSNPERGALSIDMLPGTRNDISPIWSDSRWIILGSTPQCEIVEAGERTCTATPEQPIRTITFHGVFIGGGGHVVASWNNHVDVIGYFPAST